MLCILSHYYFTLEVSAQIFILYDLSVMIVVRGPHISACEMHKCVAFMFLNFMHCL